MSSFSACAVLLAVWATAVTAVPQWNDTKCPAFWELQRPGMENFNIEDLPGYYYELAFHDATQYPLCPGKSRCITSQKAIQTHSDGVKYVNDTWNLQCFGHAYPQTLLFNITDQPGFLRGYVPTTAIPFLPKKIVANTVFPDTIVDFKAGPEGWALEFQCVELLGGVKFVGINYYSKLKTEAAFQEMDKAARARGLGFYMDKGFGLRRVNHSNCPLEPHTIAEQTSAEETSVKMTSDLYDAQETPAEVAGLCCQGACRDSGKEKYYSIASSASGTPHCGEACMDPSKYKLYHFFEKNLTKATTDSPCDSFGYTKYDSTVTHGFGPVKMTLDLYDVPGTNELPQWNYTKCPAFWELQRPGMDKFQIEDLPGFYYELAFHDATQYPLCPSRSKCITSEKAIQTHSDGVKYVNDTWNLQCFGHPYPQTLLFNVTDQPGFLRGYVPSTAIPFLPKNIVANTVFPDTVVDFKAGPEGWALEFQCVEFLGRVRFIGINYYSKLKTEAAFQEMDKAARARGLGFYMDKGLGLRRVDHSNCPLEPHAVAESANVEEILV